MLTNTELAAAARQTADLIRTYGWFRAESDGLRRFPVGNSNQCFCILTAIPFKGMQDTIDALAEFLGHNRMLSSIEASEFLESFNDMQVSAEVVLAMLEDFAKYMEEK